MKFEVVTKDGTPPAKSPKESKSYAFAEPLPEDQMELPFA